MTSNSPLRFRPSDSPMICAPSTEDGQVDALGFRFLSMASRESVEVGIDHQQLHALRAIFVSAVPASPAVTCARRRSHCLGPSARRPSCRRGNKAGARRRCDRAGGSCRPVSLGFSASAGLIAPESARAGRRYRAASIRASCSCLTAECSPLERTRERRHSLRAVCVRGCAEGVYPPPRLKWH